MSDKEKKRCIGQTDISSFFTVNKKNRQDASLISETNINASFEPETNVNASTQSHANTNACSILCEVSSNIDLELSHASSAPTGSEFVPVNIAHGCPMDLSKSADDRPMQPVLASYPKNEDNRCFRAEWFKAWVWLEYSIVTNGSYCYICRHFASCDRVSVRNQKDAFISGTGFKNWKHAMTKQRGFDGHNTSLVHILATKNKVEFDKRAEKLSVIHVQDSSRLEQIRQNRSRLAKIASCLHLCARQMIALRGHDESAESLNRGNFIEILRWASNTDPVVKSIFEDSARNATYLSSNIQNELLAIMADQIRTIISDEIKGNTFALLADESRDVSGNEQLSIVVRFVPRSTVTQVSHDWVREKFLGFVRLHEFDARALCDELVSFLNTAKIRLSDCIAQCYDGAAVMSGCAAGVQTLMRDEYMPQGMYIHCCTHRLNLVIVEVCKVVPYVSVYFSILAKLHSYFTRSSVTSERFLKARQDLNMVSSTKLQMWGDTRWDSRYKSIDAVLKNFPALLSALDELSNDQSERSVDARGILLAIRDFSFVITSFVLRRLLGPIKVLSDFLKGISVDYGAAQPLIKSLFDQFENMRNETAFKTLHKEAIEFCRQAHIDLKVCARAKPRRARKIPNRFKNHVVTSTIGHRNAIDTEDDQRNELYYPVIGAMLVELTDRFAQPTSNVLSCLSALQPDHNSFLKIESLLPLADHLSLDEVALQNELVVLKPMFADKTSATFIEFVNEVLPLSKAFPATIELCRGAMTIPVSSTSCERTFSKLKQIKTYSRNSMGDSRLSDIAVIAIERDTYVDFEQTVDIFSTKHKDSRILLR